MEVTFTPEQQTRLDETAKAVGRIPAELVQDVVAGYLEEVAHVRGMLDSRYDDIKLGRVKAIDGEVFFENLRRREDELFRQRSM